MGVLEGYTAGPAVPGPEMTAGLDAGPGQLLCGGGGGVSPDFLGKCSISDTYLPPKTFFLGFRSLDFVDMRTFHIYSRKRKHAKFPEVAPRL